MWSDWVVLGEVYEGTIYKGVGTGVGGGEVLWHLGLGTAGHCDPARATMGMSKMGDATKFSNPDEEYF